MKALIEKASPLYLKRLTRELNNQNIGDGFYMFTAENSDSPRVIRCTRARLRNGRIHGCRSGSWYPAWDTGSFSDVNGREIVAPRNAYPKSI